MSNSRFDLNQPISQNSLVQQVLDKRNLFNMPNVQYATAAGGAYSSGGVQTTCSLSYTSLFPGSNIYFYADISGRCMWPGYYYTPAALKDGVNVSSWIDFRISGTYGYGGTESASMFYRFANPASGTVISFSVTMQMQAGNPTYPFYHGKSSIVVMEWMP